MYELEWWTGYDVWTGVVNWLCVHECYFGVLLCNSGNKHQNNIQMSTQTVCHDCAYIILFVTWHSRHINENTNVDHHTSTLCLTGSVYVLLMTSQSSTQGCSCKTIWYVIYMLYDMLYICYMMWCQGVFLDSLTRWHLNRGWHHMAPRDPPYKGLMSL